MNNELLVVESIVVIQYACRKQRYRRGEMTSLEQSLNVTKYSNAPDDCSMAVLIGGRFAGGKNCLRVADVAGKQRMIEAMPLSITQRCGPLFGGSGG